jgi:hypothetical protein
MQAGGEGTEFARCLFSTQASAAHAGYGKNEKEDLTRRERKALKKLVEQLKHEAIQKASSGKQKNNG